MQSSFTKEPPETLKKATPTGLNSFAQVTKYRLQELVRDHALTSRTIAHLTMIMVVVLAIGLGNLELAWGTISAVRPLKYDPAEPVASTVTEEESIPLLLPTKLNDTQDDILVRAAVPRTIIPDRTRIEQSEPEIKTYIVKSGDTISGIAAKFGLYPETIIWSNPALERNPDLLSVGQELMIIPVDGVYYQVESGDTIDSIAVTYKVEPAAIIDYPLNQLDPDEPAIQTEQWLIIPGGNKPFVPRAVTAYSGPVPEDATVGSGIFGWPASGSITNGYYGYHPGLDIGGVMGAAILAADSGYVVMANWDNTGYGNTIIIDHGNGFQTLYAHLQTYLVDAGENVAKGQKIAEMGSTGNSTGPHLHFEIRQGTVQRNPYGFLP